MNYHTRKDIFTSKLPEGVGQAAYTLNCLAKAIHEDMRTAGFWEDRDFIDECLSDAGKSNVAKTVIEHQMLALIMSELGEAVEAIRKPRQDDHLPEYDNVGVELADAIIRILDMAHGIGIPIGDILVRKCDYNMTRPFKHGKNS